MISVVIPAHNEEENVLQAQAEISRVLEPFGDYELIFVDDGSRDKTWEKITSLASVNGSRVRGLRFSRNFGKEAAIRAGLDKASGDAVIVIDCDLQHPPEVIPEMIEKWRAGAQVVRGKKSFRGRESILHRGFVALFNGMMSRSVGFDMSGASDFILLDKTVVSALLGFGERGSFFRALAQFVGFETAEVYYDVAPRERGKGSFTFFVLSGYALRNIAAFSPIPLYFSLFCGLTASALAAVLAVLKLFSVPLGTFSGGVIALIFLSGLILISMGILGFYLSRVYEEIKARPRYLIAKDTKNAAKEGEND